jgi:hypothetical protein
VPVEVQFRTLESGFGIEQCIGLIVIGLDISDDVALFYIVVLIGIEFHHLSGHGISGDNRLGLDFPRNLDAAIDIPNRDSMFVCILGITRCLGFLLKASSQSDQKSR